MTATKPHRVAIADLRALVGDGHVREAMEADAVDGVMPAFVVAPGSAQEASAVMRMAYEARLTVAPRGGGTKMGWGNPPADLDLIVSTRRLGRVLEHAAGDLVARVEAGVTLESLHATLAGAGQILALDSPEPGATVGGIVAANASGPRRLRYGTARDLLIGVTIVLADGTIARSGGKVVKNVAGYDLCKLYTGSLGTLGIIVEAIFRLHPLPPARRVVSAGPFRHPEAVAAAVREVRRSHLVPSAVELRWHDGVGDLTALFEGVEESVSAQAEMARDMWRAHAAANITEQEGEASWRDGMPSHRQMREARGILLKINAPTASLADVLTDALDVCEADGRQCSILGHAASGVTFVGLDPAEMPPADPSALAGAIRTLRERALALDGSLVVLDAPPEVKPLVDVWGQVGDALPLMRRVKAQFDPAHILNPGRFVGGI